MSDVSENSKAILTLKKRIADLEQQLHSARLGLLTLETAQRDSATEQLAVLSTEQTGPATVTRNSSAEEKLRLFRSRFRGRTDAFATSWVSAQTGKKGWGPKTKQWVSPKAVKKSDLLPLTDDTIYQHLKSSPIPAKPFHVGLYPLLDDEHCYLLACDFDKGQ